MRIGRTDFRVIGVMEKQGGAFLGGPNFDRQVFVPITTFEKSLGGNRAHEDVTIAVKAPRQEALRDLEYAVTGEMRKIRRLHPATPDNFSINKLDTLVGTFNNMMGVLLVVGLIVTSISLFVGAIGVMNIMFVTVTERTREIGIRKAVGARHSDILVQFLVEAVLVSFFGGVAGVIAGIIGSQFKIAGVQPVIAPYSIALAFGAAVLTGLFFGTYPAGRAAALRPIEALRFE